VGGDVQSARSGAPHTMNKNKSPNQNKRQVRQTQGRVSISVPTSSLSRRPVQGRDTRGSRGIYGSLRPRDRGQGPMQSAAVAYTQLQGSSRPVVTSEMSSGDLRIRVRHREYVADVLGSVAYAVTQYAINPGLASTFPWLSQLAACFESYKFRDLCFQYRTQAATASTGKALLSVDWDAADPAPSSKLLQLQERTKADDASWQNFDLPCDRADLAKFGVQRYIRPAALAANLDIKTYDVGNLWVGVQGEANANAIGELWICYDVDLITPNQITPAVPVPGVNNGQKIVSQLDPGPGTPFAGAISTGQSYVSVAPSTLTFLVAGQYLLEMNGTGTVMTIGAATGTATIVALEPLESGVSTVSTMRSWSVTATVGQTFIIASNTESGSAFYTARIAPYLASLA
jgi:hypothetical protein